MWELVFKKCRQRRLGITLPTTSQTKLEEKCATDKQTQENAKGHV